MTQKSHLNVTQAGITALLVAAVGQVAAFVPSVAAYQQTLISAGSFAIAVGFLLANAIHHLASSKTPAVGAADVRQQVNDVLRGIVAAGLSAQQPPPAAPSPAQPPPVPPAAGPAP